VLPLTHEHPYMSGDGDANGNLRGNGRSIDEELVREQWCERDPQYHSRASTMRTVMGVGPRDKADR
jgi:hypothetical protein